MSSAADQNPGTGDQTSAGGQADAADEAPPPSSAKVSEGGDRSAGPSAESDGHSTDATAAQASRSSVGPSAPQASERPVGPPAPRPRSAQSMRDLLLSMGVVGIFVAFLYVMVLRPTPDPVKVVDVTPGVVAAKSANAFPVQVPAGLPEGWRPTSARFEMGPTPDTGSWYNGYINPQDQFVALAQQDYATGKFIAETTDEGDPEGSMTINGREWQRFHTKEPAQWSLVNQDGDVTTIVTGTVGYDQLATFVQTLQVA